MNWFFDVMEVIFPFFFIGIFVIILITFITAMVRSFTALPRGAAKQVLSALEQKGEGGEDTPKSLSGGDSLYLPMILKDFPYFDLRSAKSAVEQRIREELSSFEGVRVHRTIISGYDRTNTENVIEFQSAVEVVENGIKRQKRYVTDYSFLLTDNRGTRSAVCPHCGAEIPSLHTRKCEYCGSLLVNILGNEWKITAFCEK